MLTTGRMRLDRVLKSSNGLTAAALLGGAGVAAGLGVCLARCGLGDRITDRLFRQPGGRVAEWFYSEAKPHQASFHQILAALALGPEDHLLEVGAGGGTFLAWALATGCTATGVDHSTEMLGLASRRNAPELASGRLQLQKADAANLPFPDGKFTATAIMNAFFFFDTPQGTLAEIYRTLAPSGRIAIHTAATAPPLVGRRMFVYGDEDLVRMLEAVGFERIALRRTGPRGRDQFVTAHKPADTSGRVPTSSGSTPDAAGAAQ